MTDISTEGFKPLVIHGNEGTSITKSDFEWLDQPRITWYIQRKLKCRPEDNGKFAVLVFLEDDRGRWFTPRTREDDIFWTNGLDSCDFVHECIALFADRESAGAAIRKRRRLGSSLFVVEVDESETRLVLAAREFAGKPQPEMLPGY